MSVWMENTTNDQYILYVELAKLVNSLEFDLDIFLVHVYSNTMPIQGTTIGEWINENLENAQLSIQSDFK